MAGRKKPYTQIGIRRLKCSREGCGNMAEHSWQICSDGNVHRPCCIECDIAINRVVLEFMFPSRAAEMIAAYEGHVRHRG